MISFLEDIIKDIELKDSFEIKKKIVNKEFALELKKIEDLILISKSLFKLIEKKLFEIGQEPNLESQVTLASFLKSLYYAENILNNLKNGFRLSNAFYFRYILESIANVYLFQTKIIQNYNPRIKDILGEENSKEEEKILKTRLNPKNLLNVLYSKEAEINTFYNETSKNCHFGVVGIFAEVEYDENKFKEFISEDLEALKSFIFNISLSQINFFYENLEDLDLNEYIEYYSEKINFFYNLQPDIQEVKKKLNFHFELI